MNSRILPAIAIMLSIGIFFAYVKPIWSGAIKETRAAITSNKQALATAEEYKKRQNVLASERNEIDQNNLNKLSVFLPDSVDNVGLILDINALAARSGVSLTSINVTTNDDSSSAQLSSGALQSLPGNSVGSVDLLLSAVGTYSSVHTFLSGVEKSARLLDVRDITVKGSDTGVYNYQMTVRIYWLR